MKTLAKYGPRKVGAAYLRGLYFAYLLRTRPVLRVLRLAEAASLPAGLKGLAPPEAAGLVDAVFRRRSMPLASRCLVRSLVLYSMLRGSGVRLHLGLAPRGRGTRGGHAWVTWQGTPLLPEDRMAREQYAEFLVWPEGGHEA